MKRIVQVIIPNRPGGEPHLCWIDDDSVRVGDFLIETPMVAGGPPLVRQVVDIEPGQADEQRTKFLSRAQRPASPELRSA